MTHKEEYKRIIRKFEKINTENKALIVQGKNELKELENEQITIKHANPDGLEAK